MPRPAGRGTIISIHVLRVEDDHSRWECNRFVKISIHVLRVEDDALFTISFNLYLAFQSTSSVWRTTPPYKRGRPPRRISIHVLRVEDDLRCL